MPHRENNLFNQIISDKNLFKAIYEVNKSHRWHHGHQPNRLTARIDETIPERIKDLRRIIIDGFEPAEPRISERYDESAEKWRTISEPRQWPDQYVHHALIQVLQPVLMKRMDFYCCGSIKNRGSQLAKASVEKWVRTDKTNTKYCLMCDIRHFYDSLLPEVVMSRMRHIIKDAKTLDLIERIINDGVHIGAYTSQWLANTVLQPLDDMIRTHGCAKYYVRYMDNITIFGRNKRKLRRLRESIQQWLNANGLELKHDWQIFKIDGKKTREPIAVGYRYGRTYTIIRKHNLKRIKRAINWFTNMEHQHKHITGAEASGIISRLGQLIHCNNYNLYKKLFKGQKILKRLKQIVKRDRQLYNLKWEEYLAQRAEKRKKRELTE